MNININSRVIEKINGNNKVIISQLQDFLRTYSVMTKDLKCYRVEDIIIYDEKNSFSIGRYFEGDVLDGEKKLYNGDIRDVVLSDVKNRRTLNLERKENFIYKDTLYLYNGLDVSIKEVKEELIYKNNFEEGYEKNIVLEFKNKFTYGKTNNEKNSNTLKCFLVGTIRHVVTLQGEEKNKIQKQLKELNINIDNYNLEKLLNHFNITKK